MSSDVHEAHLPVIVSLMIGLEILQKHLRFDHHIVASLLPQGTGLPIAGDACIDETRVDLRESLVVHAILLERIR
jgi:hypothetical protein